MKKFVFKVIGITLLGIFSITCLAYAALLIFVPQAIASYYDKVGNYDRATIYMYKRYQISGDRNDLIRTCKYAVKSENTEKEEKYLGLLVEDEGFYAYCLSDSGSGEGFYDFYCGKYAEASYLNAGSDEARLAVAAKAKTLTEKYTDSCALRALTFECVRKADVKTLDAIKDYLLEIYSADADNELLGKDISNLEAYLNATEG